MIATVTAVAIAATKTNKLKYRTTSVSVDTDVVLLLFGFLSEISRQIEVATKDITNNSTTITAITILLIVSFLRTILLSPITYLLDPSFPG